MALTSTDLYNISCIMMTYRISTSKKFLCNVIGFTIFHLSHVFFYWRFCVCFISKRKIKEKRGKHPDGLQIFTFSLKNRFVWHQRFLKEIWQMIIWSENVWREFDVKIFMVRWILLGKRFLVVGTWQTPVWKRLKWSALNFAHTFLTDCCTKPCWHFS